MASNSMLPLLAYRGDVMRFLTLLLLVGFAIFYGLFREELDLIENLSESPNSDDGSSSSSSTAASSFGDAALYDSGSSSDLSSSSSWWEDGSNTDGTSSALDEDFAGYESNDQLTDEDASFVNQLDALSMLDSLPEECQSFIDDSLRLDLSAGRYILREDDDTPPPYDHQSCFLMKPRYNCAYSYEERPEHVAGDYVWVLGNGVEYEECRIDQLVRNDGGPASLATTTTQRRTIVLFGTSFLRQTFQSLACTYRHQITKGYVQIGGTTASITRAGWTLPFRFGEIQEIFELNNSTSADDVRWSGCHDYGVYDLSSFYREGVDPPEATFEKCNDDVSMIEYDSKIQIYYVFRPWRYSAERLLERLELLGCQAGDVDTVVFSEDTEEINEHGWDRPEFVNARYIDFASVLDTLRNQQLRDLNYQFGADNPWILDPPDAHPCMPGIPDDEANILLTLLRYNLSL
jgi:hypothetical protein